MSRIDRSEGTGPRASRPVLVAAGVIAATALIAFVATRPPSKSAGTSTPSSSNRPAASEPPNAAVRPTGPGELLLGSNKPAPRPPPVPSTEKTRALLGGRTGGTVEPPPRKPPSPGELPPGHPAIARDDGAQVGIQWLGHSCFYIHSPAGIGVVTDPFDPKATGLPAPTVGAHLVTVSSAGPEHDHVEAIHPFQGATREVVRATEARRGDVHVVPFPAGPAESGDNTAYLIEAGAMRIVHLGDLTRPLSPEQVKALGRVDVLMLPVGEKSLSPKEAAAVTRAIQPRVVLPMAYAAPQMEKGETDLRSLDAFVAASPFAVTAREMDVMVLSPAELPPSTEIYTLKYGH